MMPKTSQNWSEGGWFPVPYSYRSFKFVSEYRQRPAYTCLCTVHSLLFTTDQHCTRCFWRADSDPLQAAGSFCFLQTMVRDASTCEKLSSRRSSQSPYIEHHSRTQTDRTTALSTMNEIDHRSHSCPHTPSTLSARTYLFSNSKRYLPMSKIKKGKCVYLKHYVLSDSPLMSFSIAQIWGSQFYLPLANEQYMPSLPSCSVSPLFGENSFPLEFEVGISDLVEISMWYSNSKMAIHPSTNRARPGVH